MKLWETTNFLVGNDELNGGILMNTQLSLFEQEFTAPTTVQQVSKIIMFPGIQTSTPRPNYRKGEEQTVFPIKRQEDLEAMASWLYNNADRKYLLGFILGINLGLRANELLELKHSDIFFPNGEIKYVSDDFSDTTDKMSVYQNKVHKRRGMYLNESCVKALDWYFPVKSPSLFRDTYLFPSRERRVRRDRDGNIRDNNVPDIDGNYHIEVDSLRKVLKDAAEACGLKQNIGTHTLRKTFGYFHYQANHDIVFLQRLFGHSSALITMRYIGIADEEEKKSYHEVSIDLMGRLGIGKSTPVSSDIRTD